jgi:hypothetical protein
MASNLWRRKEGEDKCAGRAFTPAFYLAILIALAAAFLMQRVKGPDWES